MQSSKLSLPTNKQPVFYRRDALPVTKPTAPSAEGVQVYTISRKTTS